MKWLNPLFIISLVTFCLGACSPEASEKAIVPQTGEVPGRSDQRLRSLAGGPARVVWVQDLGDGTDTGLESNNLRLMGFDTEDGAGERAILAEPANYARPLITPAGDRIVFSDRSKRRIRLVHWDGSGLRTLRSGLALSVWADPAGREWIYYGDEVKKERLVSNVYRCQIDDPSISEPVWTKTSVGLNNFQVSEDGKRAGGVFPWPDCGVAELPDGHLRVYGKGCYPSLAPDNAGLFWIFDGSHRNLLFFQHGTKDRWRIPINTASEIEGYEVYYPRWSNQTRYLVITGPFKEGTGDNRIRAGGLEVEIYVGRFSSDFRSVEEWTRVTQNQLADFYPDLWVASPVTQLPESARLPEVRDRIPELPVFPNLAFMWENRSRPNEVLKSDGTALICQVEPAGRARYGRNFEMLIDRGNFTVPKDIMRQAWTDCRVADAFSLNLLLTSAVGGSRPPAAICAFNGKEARDWQFLLGENAGRLVCMARLKTGVLSEMLDLGPLPAGEPVFISLNCAAPELICRLNGKETARLILPELELGNWDIERLTFGAAPENLFQWSGRLENITFYSRVLSEKEMTENYEAAKLSVSQRLSAAVFMLDAWLLETPKIPSPADIAPYRRALAACKYRLKNTLTKNADFPVEFLVAEWVIMDGKLLCDTQRTSGESYRLRLESFEDHPELEGERLIMDADLWDLPLYYPADI